MIKDPEITWIEIERNARNYLLKIRQAGRGSSPSLLTNEEFERVVKQLTAHTERQLRGMGRRVNRRGRQRQQKQR